MDPFTKEIRSGENPSPEEASAIDSKSTEVMLMMNKKIKAPAPPQEGEDRGSKRARKSTGVIVSDISNGLEPVKIRAVNQVRDSLIDRALHSEH